MTIMGSATRVDNEPLRLPAQTRRRAALVLFLTLGFGVPWAGWTAMQLLHIPNPWRQPTALGWALFLTGDFCTVAGVIASYRAYGTTGLRELARRCTVSDVPWRWWCFALLMPFSWNIAASALVAVETGSSRGVFPMALAQILAPSVLARFITGPLGEEAGWRGFLLPELLRRCSPLTASIVLGLIWTLWHLPLYLGNAIENPRFALVFTISTICFTVQMTAMALATRGNLILAVLFHWSINIAPNISLALFGLGAEHRHVALALPSVLLLIAVTCVTVMMTRANRWTSAARPNATSSQA